MLNRKNTIVSVIVAAAALATLGAASAANPRAVHADFNRPLASTAPARNDIAQLEIQARVNADATWHRIIELRADQPVLIAMSGDGDTDLDLFLLNVLGEVIVADVGPTDQSLIFFRPHSSGRHLLVVRNTGPVYNEFTLQLRQPNL